MVTIDVSIRKGGKLYVIRVEERTAERAFREINYMVNMIAPTNGYKAVQKIEE